MWIHVYMPRVMSEQLIADKYVTYQYEKRTLKSAFPQFLWIIFTVRVDENWPLVPGNLQLTPLQGSFDSAGK